MPGDVAALSALIDHLELTLSNAEDYDPTIEAEYKRKAGEKLEIFNKLRDFKLHREDDRANFEDRKEAWKERIKRIVGELSSKFYSNFEKIPSSSGKIELLETPSLKDYGLRMMVSYREGENREPLSYGGHSGGEKKMATAMFLLVLQKLSPCPLRIVDEINQG